MIHSAGAAASVGRLFGLFQRVSPERSWNRLRKRLSRVFTPDQRGNYKHRQQRVQNDGLKTVFPGPVVEGERAGGRSVFDLRL